MLQGPWRSVFCLSVFWYLKDTRKSAWKAICTVLSRCIPGMSATSDVPDDLFSFWPSSLYRLYRNFLDEIAVRRFSFQMEKRFRYAYLLCIKMKVASSFIQHHYFSAKLRSARRDLSLPSWRLFSPCPEKNPLRERIPYQNSGTTLPLSIQRGLASTLLQSREIVEQQEEGMADAAALPLTIKSNLRKVFCQSSNLIWRVMKVIDILLYHGIGASLITLFFSR